MTRLSVILLMGTAGCGFTTLPPLPGQDSAAPPVDPPVPVDAFVPELDSGPPVPATPDC